MELNFSFLFVSDIFAVFLLFERKRAGHEKIFFAGHNACCSSKFLSAELKIE